MKKAVVTILLVLPFILIFFISFTGQILSKYTHIQVERITILDDKGDEYKKDSVIKIGVGEEKSHKLNIKVYPEFASNKEVSISGGGVICSVDAQTFVVTGHELGEATIIITSKDKTSIQFSITIKVAQDDISDIVLTTDSPDGNLTLMKRQTKQVRAVIVPYTVPIENRELVWESSNSNIASVSQNGSVTGVGYGTATITVTSVLYPNISKSFSVVVTSDMQKGVWWDKGDADYYGVTTSILDLKTLVLIEDLPVVTQSDLRYKIVSGDLDKVDKTQLSEGIIAFTTTDVMVRVMVSYNDGTNTYKDYIDIWYR